MMHLCCHIKTNVINQQSSLHVLCVWACIHFLVIILCNGFRVELPRMILLRENFLEAHWPPNRSTLAAPGEVAGAVLVGGARETPGSAAAGVGVAAAEEGAGSAVRVGSDSKESPISASTSGGVWKPQSKPPPKKKATKHQVVSQNKVPNQIKPD